MSTVYAQTKRVENLHLTRERDRRRGRELATFLLAGLPVACALLGYAALHIETVRVGYLREARQKTMAQLTEENRRLRAELGRASSPERVSALAKNKGLRAPHPGQVQYVERAASPSTPAPAAPAEAAR
jgi:cell division protein FtsB